MIPSTEIIVNGKRMSRLALGTHLYGRENAGLCRSLLDGFFSGGGNVIDTGRVYHGGEIIEVLNKYIKNGSLRHIGASNWTCARISEANAYAAEHGLQPFEFSELAF